MYEEQSFGKIYKYIVLKSIKNYEKRSSPIIADDVFDNLISHHFLPLLRRCWERLLMVEMNLAEAEGLLRGETTCERFEYFTTEIIKKENFSALLNKYSGLWTRWARQARTLLKAVDILAYRIDEDLLSAALFFYHDIYVAEITEICTLGDPHRGMQQTTRIRYINEHGTARTIYYKPRNLAIDVGFGTFIEWWNTNAEIDHLVPRVLSRENYGWAQHIEHAACTNEKEVQQYYQRYGSLVALAHILGSTDLHRENVVASGCYPVIVDNETLFSCTLDGREATTFDCHLYSSLLLPTHKIRGLIETSPLTAGLGDTDIEVRINLQRRESDARMEILKGKTKQCSCEVMLGENPIADWLFYTAHIEDGMRQTYDFMRTERTAILAQLQVAMRNVPIRLIYRSTPDYITVLDNSWHPDAMIDGEVQRDLLRLAIPFMDPCAVEDELKQLQDGDVPYFETIFDQPIVMGRGGLRLPLSVHCTPIQKLQKQLSRLSTDFIEQTNNDLQYALTAYKLRQGVSLNLPQTSVGRVAVLPQSGWLDVMARWIMDAVLEQVLIVNGNYCWRTITGASIPEIQAGLTNQSLYDGTAGIALAFHVTGKQLNERKYLNFAQRLAVQLARQIDANPVAEQGALTGTAATLWVISLISERPLLLQPVVHRTLSKLCSQFLSHKWEDYSELDYVSGTSGTIEMLLRLHQRFIDYPVAHEIRELAALLFERVVRFGKLLRKEDTLLGFAHGTAGTSAVLARFMRQLSVHNEEAQLLITSNVQREMHFRSEGGWPRLDQDGTVSTSWCHGTAGFGFSRIHLQGFMDPAILKRDMEIVRSRLTESRASIGLCHGLMADYCLERALGRAGNDILDAVRQTIECNGLTTDYGLSGFELVGAMTGVTSLFTGPAILANRLVL